MSDIIQLLPDSIANQIAAGEVIQRPASAVKELLENAIDAGATEIKLVLKEAGKLLIQVVDNGKGMSETDARMSFERHATSKIKNANDLFALTTMGFRGEALASIAAIAQVELKTRQEGQELGTQIIIEGSKVLSQEPCQCQVGTSISIKNLFFNVPARRNFLKSNSVENRHIIDEFSRVALANSNVFFSLHHNQNELYHLPIGNLRQRIVGVLGNNGNKKLVPMSEETDVVKFSGFVSKPEFAKKTRGEQFFFVNNRFIKSGYLHHAIMNAYEDLLPENSYPLYVIFMELDPKIIDVNVHPTKQEIKFEDEKIIYNYLRVATRHALGQYSITPTLDFDQDPNISQAYSQGPSIQRSQPTEMNWNPSSQASPMPQSSSRPASTNSVESSNLENWQKLYKGLTDLPMTIPEDEFVEEVTTIASQWGQDELIPEEKQGSTGSFQLHSSYIVSPIKSGYLLIDQQAAHERILYEKYIRVIGAQQQHTQALLFPINIPLSNQDSEVLKEILPEINQMGFDVQEFGANTFVLQGLPAECSENVNVEELIQILVEQQRENKTLNSDIKTTVAGSLARSTAIKRGTSLGEKEVQTLIDQLFACEMPYANPWGKKCFITYDLDDLRKQFEI